MLITSHSLDYRCAQCVCIPRYIISHPRYYLIYNIAAQKLPLSHPSPMPIHQSIMDNGKCIYPPSKPVAKGPFITHHQSKASSIPQIYQSKNPDLPFPISKSKIEIPLLPQSHYLNSPYPPCIIGPIP